jgi:hypothetical protein
MHFKFFVSLKKLPQLILFHLVGFKIRMNKNEQVLFIKYIRKSKYYLEFGLGGSTFIALRKSNALVHTVESDQEWIRKIKKSWYAKYQLLTRLKIHFSDIGPTKQWGYPETMDRKDFFPDYSAGVFKNVDTSKIDLVLVDGRFRVACVLQTIMNCSRNNGLKILIHDFYNRPHYHGLIKYLLEIDKADNLGVFVIKPGINLQEVASDYEAFKFTAQ